MTTRFRPLLLLGVSLLIVVSGPAGLYVTMANSEPYPALLQPRFAGSPERDGLVTLEQARIEVRADDGRISRLSPAEALPPTGVLPSAVLESLYPKEPSAAGQDPKVDSWFVSQLQERMGAQVAAVSISWLERTYNLSNGKWVQENVLNSYVIGDD